MGSTEQKEISPENKIRIMDACLILEDALIISRITGNDKSSSISTSLDYLKEKGNITCDDLSRRQLERTNNMINNTVQILMNRLFRIEKIDQIMRELPFETAVILKEDWANILKYNMTSPIESPGPANKEYDRYNHPFVNRTIINKLFTTITEDVCEKHGIVKIQLLAEVGAIPNLNPRLVTVDKTGRENIYDKPSEIIEFLKSLN
jgi:hypothetical protein